MKNKNVIIDKLKEIAENEKVSLKYIYDNINTYNIKYGLKLKDSDINILVKNRLKSGIDMSPSNMKDIVKP